MFVAACQMNIHFPIAGGELRKNPDNSFSYTITAQSIDGLLFRPTHASNALIKGAALAGLPVIGDRGEISYYGTGRTDLRGGWTGTTVAVFKGEY